MMNSATVFMSTYNGEKYIKEQIDSILSQTNVEIRLLIRDDGSTDKTKEIISKKYVDNKKVILISEENLGWQLSFIKLLYSNILPETDYYAFADQDDVWLPDKLERAINLIQKSKKKKVLYFSQRTFCNQDLEILQNNTELNKHYNPKFYLPNEYYSLSYLPAFGCTMVFDNDFYTLLKKINYDRNSRLAHDWVVYLAATFCGSIIYDKESRILYRRHTKTATGHKSKFDLNKFSFDTNLSIPALLVYNSFKDLLSEKQLKKCEDFICLNHVKNKIKLVFNRYVCNNTLKGTIYLKLSIIFAKYHEKKI